MPEGEEMTLVLYIMAVFPVCERAVVIDYFHFKESNRGRMDIPEVGAAGERGEFQIRPIFVRDVERISGYRIRTGSNTSCIIGINFWLNHYLPLATDFLGRRLTVKEQWSMYNRGYSGWKRTINR